MKKINSFDKTTLPLVREAIINALKQVTEQFGLQDLEIGAMTYTPEGDHFSCSLKGKVKAENNPKLLEKQTSDSRNFGYDRNIIGEVFLSDGKEFEVVGFDLKRPKYPISVKCLTDGKGYKFGAKQPLKFKNKDIQYSAANNLMFVTM